MAAHLDPIRQVLDNELAGEVQRAIESLPPLQREALVLFEYEDLSLAEIGAIVGADANTRESAVVPGSRQTAREAGEIFPDWP